MYWTLISECDNDRLLLCKWTGVAVPVLCVPAAHIDIHQSVLLSVPIVKMSTYGARSFSVSGPSVYTVCVGVHCSVHRSRVLVIPV